MSPMNPEPYNPPGKRFRPCAPIRCPGCGRKCSLASAATGVFRGSNVAICGHCAATIVRDNFTARKMEESDYARLPIAARMAIDNARREVWLWLARHRV